MDCAEIGRAEEGREVEAPMKAWWVPLLECDEEQFKERGKNFVSIVLALVEKEFIYGTKPFRDCIDDVLVILFGGFLETPRGDKLKNWVLGEYNKRVKAQSK